MKEVKLKNFKLDIVRKLNYDWVKETKTIPMSFNDNKLMIIQTEEDSEAVRYLSFQFNMPIEIVRVSHEKFLSIFNGLYHIDIERLDTKILQEAVMLNVSDIHMEPFKDEVLIRFRIDGSLVLYKKILYKEYLILLSKIKIISNLDISEKRIPQDGKFQKDIEGLFYDFRVATVPVQFGEKLVIRILYGNTKEFTIKDLDLNDNQRSILEKLIRYKSGLILVNGPTGSGKSTTLYTILKSINSEDVNIMTLEDPAEEIIKGVNQINLNRKVGLDFATGLRSILRNDPDTVLVGEIRDEETAEMAIRIALTGHKVYSTIHTNTAKEVFYRLEDMGIKKYLIKLNLIGIISQRLVRVLCENCKEKSNEIIFDGVIHVDYRAKGCKNCNYTGYKGRKMVAAVHNLKITKEGDKLDNSQMVENLSYYFKNGRISYEDYKDFILSEGLEEYD